MRKEQVSSFISAQLSVGAGLFLVLLLFIVCCLLYFRFAYRMVDSHHCFTDSLLIHYSKTWSYCFHQRIQEVTCSAVSSVKYSDIS